MMAGGLDRRIMVGDPSNKFGRLIDQLNRYAGSNLTAHERPKTSDE
jgi:hypothetical protein